MRLWIDQAFIPFYQMKWEKNFDDSKVTQYKDAN